MIYILTILLIIVIAVMLLNIRIKAIWSSTRKWFFVGLGRTGIEFDVILKKGVFKLAGIPIRRFDTISDKEKKIRKLSSQKKATDKPAPSRRQRSWRLALQILPKCSKELISYFVNILKTLVIEELEAELEGGFDSPDMTGTAFGYYQAALAAVPSIFSRIRYVPDWTSASISGSARLSIAMPLYKFIWRTVVLIWRLPLRKVFKLAIGTKKGE